MDFATVISENRIDSAKDKKCNVDNHNSKGQTSQGKIHHINICQYRYDHNRIKNAIRDMQERILPLLAQDFGG